MSQRVLTATYVIVLVAFVPLVVAWAPQTPSAASFETRAEREAFLSKARIVPDPAASGGTPSRRVALDDGAVQHDAAVETADGSGPTRRDYRFNVAAYQLDKLIGLHLVPPCVERLVSGRLVSLTWWVDDFAMNEVDRRRQGIDPPDLESWNHQMHAVRVFDELISNTYRDPSPPLYLNSVWDNLLITKQWTVWITDHTGAFRTRTELQAPETLTRCPRAVLAGLRTADRDLLQRTLGKYLSSRQLDALEMRRALLVKHFDAQVAVMGQAAVLYDLPRRP